MLKTCEGFTRLLPTTVVLVCYFLAFWRLSIGIKSIPVAYALWAGIGIVLVAIIGFFLYGQRLDLPAIIGIGLIISGTLVINLFSQSSGH